MKNKARLITFKKLGKPAEGYISVCEQNSDVPFEIKRVFWTYHTPDSVTRGRHTHHDTEMVLIALSGIIEVQLEDLEGNTQQFVLKNPNEGLYIPPYTWHIMEYSHTSVQLVIASTLYDENDYIRDYNDFKSMVK